MKLLPYLFFFTLISFGQTPTKFDQRKDSVVYYLKNAKDSLKIKYLKRAIQLSKEIKNDSLYRECIIQYGIASYFDRDTLGLKESNQNLKNLYKTNKDSLSLAKVFHFKALIKKLQFKLDSSYVYYNKSKDISIKLKDSSEVGRRLLSMGLMQKNENDLIGAESSLIECLKYMEPLDYYGYTGSAYNNLGLTLIELNNTEEARKSFKKSFNFYSIVEDSILKKRGYLDFYNNTGFSYIRDNEYSQAIPYLEKGLETKNIENDFQDRYESLYGNLADSYYEIGKKEIAWRMVFELLNIRKKSGDIFGQSRSHNGIANYYIKERNRQKALYHSHKGYKLSKQTSNNYIMMLTLSKLANLELGKKSKKYLNEYIDLRDSLQKKERISKNQFAKVRYETEKKDKENASLKLTKEQNEREIERQKQQKVIGWLFSIVAILALVLSFTFYRVRRKKLMYEAQLQKASAREEERQQIAKSLHDEVAGDLRMLHQKLAKNKQSEEAQSIEKIKENVRNLSHQLSSESFDEVSFKDQIINLIADAFSPSFRVSVNGIDTVSWEEINPQIKRTLYLCARESLQNTQKYAGATKFTIVFLMQKKEILMEMKDNGKGIDESKKSKGIGLKNLKERVEEIHGSFHISSSEEATTTKVSIPVNG